jgi:pimeloyl-ACP methyl ester carboxylesterase
MSRHHRILALCLAVPFVAAACGGAISSTAPSGASSAAAAPSASASTELVADIDVGGRTMHLVCLGPTDTGEPTVLLEGGLGAQYTAWGEVLFAMQKSHRLCAYDRAGLGMSEPAPETSRTTNDLVDDLRALLDAAGVEGPFVLGSHSMGAWPAAVFAERYPDDVVGFVVVDPRGPRVSDEWRDALPPAATGEPEAVAANREELGAFETDPSMNDEHLDLAASAAQASAALDADGPLFGDRPVVVLSAANTPQSWHDLPTDLATTFDGIWAAGQQEFADESTAGTLTVVPNVGHDIQLEQPPAVIEALESMLAGVAGQ